MTLFGDFHRQIFSFWKFTIPKNISRRNGMETERVACMLFNPLPLS